MATTTKTTPTGKNSRCTINRDLLPLKAFNFLMYGACMVIPYITVFLKQLGLSASEIGIISGCSVFFCLFTRPIIGLMADKVGGRKTALVVCCMGFGTCFFCLRFLEGRVPSVIDTDTNTMMNGTRYEMPNTSMSNVWMCRIGLHDDDQLLLNEKQRGIYNNKYNISNNGSSSIIISNNSNRNSRRSSRSNSKNNIINSNRSSNRSNTNGNNNNITTNNTNITTSSNSNRNSSNNSKSNSSNKSNSNSSSSNNKNDNSAVDTFKSHHNFINCTLKGPLKSTGSTETETAFLISCPSFFKSRHHDDNNDNNNDNNDTMHAYRALHASAPQSSNNNTADNNNNNNNNSSSNSNNNKSDDDIDFSVSQNCLLSLIVKSSADDSLPDMFLYYQLGFEFETHNKTTSHCGSGCNSSNISSSSSSRSTSSSNSSSSSIRGDSSSSNTHTIENNDVKMNRVITIEHSHKDNENDNEHVPISHTQSYSQEYYDDNSNNNISPQKPGCSQRQQQRRCTTEVTHSFAVKIGNSLIISIPKDSIKMLHLPPEILVNYDDVNDDATSFLPSHIHLDYVFVLAFTINLIARALYASTTSLADALVYSILGSNRHRWARQRLWGSIGTGTTIIATTTVSAGFNKPNDLTVLFTGCLCLTFLACLVVVARLNTGSMKKSTTLFQDMQSVLTNPAFRLLLCKLVLYGFMTGAAQNFFMWFLADIGGSPFNLALTVVVHCISSIIMLRLTGHLLKKLGPLRAMYMVLVAYALRFMAVSFIESPWTILPLELLHGITYSVLWAAASGSTSKMAAPGTQATCHGIAGAVYWDLGRGIGILVTGQFIQEIGARWTFRAYAVICAVALPLFYALDWMWSATGSSSLDVGVITQVEKEDVALPVGADEKDDDAASNDDAVVVDVAASAYDDDDDDDDDEESDYEKEENSVTSNLLVLPTTTPALQQPEDKLYSDIAPGNTNTPRVAGIPQTPNGAHRI